MRGPEDNWHSHEEEDLSVRPNYSFPAYDWLYSNVVDAVMITDIFSTLPKGTKFEINGLSLGQEKQKSVRSIKRTEFEISVSETVEK